MKKLPTTRLSRGCAVAVLAVCTWCVAAPGPGVVRPWDDTGTPLDVGRPTGSLEVHAIVDLQTGADHIVGQQCLNGGWGWPHADCSITYFNITAPISLGLLDVYPFTGAAAHLASATAGGGYELTSQYPNTESRFGTFAPYYLSRLSAATGDPQYSTHAATNFFGALNAGTYGPSDLNTAGWIAAVQAGRAGAYINMRPWEFHTLIQTATSIGNPGQDTAFRQALLDGLNTLDDTQPFAVYYNLLGLAGGVRGLAMGGYTLFPPITSPNFMPINGITTLKDLADVLAGYQNVNGSWYWASNIPSPVASDEDTQTTAYAVLALMAADPLVTSNYSFAIANGRSWINSMQLLSGGYLSYPGGDENTEVEGEALSATAIAAAAPPGDDCATAIAAPGPVDPCNDTTPTVAPWGGSCTGSAMHDDVWVSFMAPATSTRVRTDIGSTGTDSAFVVYSGTCGTLTEVGCAEDISGTVWTGNTCVGGLTVGATYYVRVGDWADGACGPYVVTIQAAGTCGNSVVDCGEACDGGVCCSATCQINPVVCGDSALCGTEQCDDGNVASGDGCSATCQLEAYCGDNIINNAETCDGAALPQCAGGSYCATNCQCVEGIPAVSEWGLAVLLLIGLVSGTILFGRRRAAVN